MIATIYLDYLCRRNNPSFNNNYIIQELEISKWIYPISHVSANIQATRLSSHTTLCKEYRVYVCYGYQEFLLFFCFVRLRVDCMAVLTILYIYFLHFISISSIVQNYNFVFSFGDKVIIFGAKRHLRQQFQLYRVSFVVGGNLFASYICY